MQIASKETSAPLEISLSTSPGESARNTPHHLTAGPILLTNLRNSFHGITTRQPAYDAIPYVWGDPSLTVPILLDEIEYPVTVNLELALRYCRLESNSRVMWADASCIYVY